MSHEIRRLLPLARQVHDRDAVRRADPLLLDELWSDPATRVLVVHENATLVSQEDVVYLSPAAATGLTKIYLGRHEGSAFVAVLTDDAFTADAAMAAAVSTVDTTTWRDLRLMGPALGELDVGLVTQAVAMANWHRSHSFSPQRGEAAGPQQWLQEALGRKPVFVYVMYLAYLRIISGSAGPLAPAAVSKRLAPTRARAWT